MIPWGNGRHGWIQHIKKVQDPPLTNVLIAVVMVFVWGEVGRKSGNRRLGDLFASGATISGIGVKWMDGTIRLSSSNWSRAHLSERISNRSLKVYYGGENPLTSGMKGRKDMKFKRTKVTFQKGAM